MTTTPDDNTKWQQLPATTWQVTTEIMT
jgi:hypothetical protein